MSLSARLIPCLDLTLLDKDAKAPLLEALADEARTALVAAICVYPEHLSYFSELNQATVLNFPEGLEPIEDSLKALDAIHAQEIDYVFPYQLDRAEALKRTGLMLKACQAEGRLSKVILETGVLAENTIEDLGLRILDLGADFLKTSTGKVAQGASLVATEALLRAILRFGEPRGLKVSGGVREVAQAQAYVLQAEAMMGKAIDKSWFRVGASALLRALQEEKV